MLNHIDIVGRLTRDPDARSTGSGKAVTNFQIACDRDFKNGGEKETDFINIVVWGKSAEFVATYLKKGRLAGVSGRLQMREWTDKDGNKRTTFEINAENVYALDKGAGETQSKPKFEEVYDEDDLPF